MMYNVLMDKIQAAKENKTDKVSTDGMPAWKVFMYATIGFVGLSALIGVFLILFSETSFVKDSVAVLLRIVGTTSILGLFCLLTMNHIFRCKNKKQLVRIVAIIGLIMNIIWLVPWMLNLWNAYDGLKDRCERPVYSYNYSRYGTRDYERRYDDYQDRLDKYHECLEPYDNAVEISWKTVVTAGALAILLTLIANYTIFENYTSAIRALKVTAISCAVLLVGTLILVLDFEVKDLGDAYWKFVMIAGIVFIFALVITPILVRVQKKKHEAEMSEKEIIVEPITKPLFDKKDGTETADVMEVAEAAEAKDDHADLKEQIKTELREEMKDEAKEKELREKVEEELREKIEKEMRDKIEAEMKEKESQTEESAKESSEE